MGIVFGPCRSCLRSDVTVHKGYVIRVNMKVGQQNIASQLTEQASFAMHVFPFSLATLATILGKQI